MRVTYELVLREDAVTVIAAKCQLPLHGRWTELSITSYCLHYRTENTSTAINFGFRPIRDSELRCSSLDATQNGLLRLSRGTVGQRQEFEQSLEVPVIIGALLDYSDLSDGGVPAGRAITDSILRRIESLIETARQRIRACMSRDAEVRDMTISEIERRYGKATANAIGTFLGQIDWRLMLAKAGCDEDQLGVVEYAMGHNPPRFLSLSEESSRDIPTITHSPLNRFGQAAKTTIADMKASALLRNVCGDELYTEFEKTGQITVKAQGYTFVIRPDEWVSVTDPNGKKASLCIHVLSFSVNPIDELVIGWLHIRHKLSAYLKEAVVHRPEPGFRIDLAA